MIRTASNRDGPAVMCLVDAVYHEYGDHACPETGDRDLLDLQAHYFDRGGHFWVLELDGTIAGSHGALPVPDDADACQFRRLYLADRWRGGSWGRALMQVSLDWAAARGYRAIQFWSDTRFHRAHRFFERCGFRPDGRVRQMNDGSSPYEEFFFSMRLPDGRCGG